MKYKVDDPWSNRIRTRHVTTETPSTTTDTYLHCEDPVIGNHVSAVYSYIEQANL
jgi:hypothetical protein